MSIVRPISALKDNYIWMITHPSSKHTLVVDPGEADPVLAVLNKEHLILTAILITHHHWDHTQGISALLKHRDVPVYYPATESVAKGTHPVQQNDLIHVPQLNSEFKVLDIPGHTSGHVAYVGVGGVFCGDTLFTAGCGRIFEGSAEQLWNSLQALARLPKETLVYCGHEYTERNLEFALTVQPHDEAIANRLEETRKLRVQGIPSVPATMDLELATNPFLRCHLPTIQQAIAQHFNQKISNPVAAFALLRAWKDHF